MSDAQDRSPASHESDAAVAARSAEDLAQDAANRTDGRAVHLHQSPAPVVAAGEHDADDDQTRPAGSSQRF